MWPHRLQHARLPCLSPTSRVYSNSCSTESVMPSNHLILCCPLLLLPSISPSIKVFSNESALLIRWPKYWSSSFNISPSNEYSGPISFRMGLVGFPCSPRDSQEFYPTQKVIIANFCRKPLAVMLSRMGWFYLCISKLTNWYVENGL